MYLIFDSTRFQHKQRGIQTQFHSSFGKWKVQLNEIFVGATELEILTSFI